MTTQSNKIQRDFFPRIIFSLFIGLSVLFTWNVHNLSASEISYWKDVHMEKQVTYPDGWFYTLQEIKHQYLIEYNEGKRLSNCITKKKMNYVTSCNGDDFFIPEAFVTKTLELIKALLEQGLTRYIFRLDAFHGHLFVPEYIFIKEYSSMTTEEMIRNFTNEDSLGVLFHNAEHLALRDPPGSGAANPEARALIEKRNVIGWYGAKPLEVIKSTKDILLSDRKSLTAAIPAGYKNVGVITFRATRNGEFSITHNGEEIRIDISPYECYYH
jgi:hypothetical protein